MSQAINGVMFQYFHWFLDIDDVVQGNQPLWVFLKQQADHLRDIGIDAVWIPPPTKGSSGTSSTGYDIHDPYDLGEFPQRGPGRSKYGTKQQLHEAINALHGYSQQADGSLVKDPNKRYLQVIGDIVLNHRAGGDQDDYWQAVRVDKEDRNQERWDPGFESGLIEIKAYTSFTFPARAGKHSSFTWSARHFDSVDTAYKLKQNGLEFDETGGKYIYRFIYNEQGFEPNLKNFEKWVSLEKGNYDYLQDCDLDYGREDVRLEVKTWGTWLVDTIGLDGVRLDAVKHITGGYIQEWLGHLRWKTGKPLFAVAEYIAGDTGTLHSYLTRVTATDQFPQPVTLFDFPLWFHFKDASKAGDSYDLRSLDHGTLMAEQPRCAVTFVENHDYQFGREYNSHVEEWFKPLAYAYILLRDKGYPCLFFPDYYGSHDSGHHRARPSGRNYLDLLLKLRKQFALGEERFYANRNVAGWVRMGGVEGARGAMAVVINNGFGRVQAIRMNTGRFGKRFYHLATLKLFNDKYVVAAGAYGVYGDKSDALWTDSHGWADFVADGGSVSIWIEDGVGIT
ncbi:alpha-amylase [Synechococcus sp. Cruz-9H2]|uniref:alpha-amylase n=1 Tax=unclassified Synechococcus TaxID=2626047 RepID=UPI0020CCA58B|nr:MULTISPECIES: alpha-amylase [unclassified Synechococcus]MCP9819821.1 alpha-amylase [Synechococcus sp. Cruz-9H2]MCP9844113.1 alpha-amylase [Synechococcus sp. Edmonson 11F2]MCP9856251.1 alpha-amylase [Synechococcus sp. Cruz-9C9]MCP9863536.1 alpha-amylase [Synechococcus sp. Cruz-7E5]MCP9870732.1 alpha-amylase [Synechococcus sp. Cruz-7B9]